MKILLTLLVKSYEDRGLGSFPVMDAIITSTLLGRIKVIVTNRTEIVLLLQQLVARLLKA